MPRFTYIATNNQNRTITGQVEEASDRSAVLGILIKQGLRPISIKEINENVLNKSIFGSGIHVKSDSLVMFTRQLSAMIGAGVPLLRALSSLQGYTESQSLAKVLKGAIKDVEGGVSLSEALGKYPTVFSEVYINMIAAGEAAGILDEILKRLAVQQEKNASIRKRVRSAMAYPLVLISITIIAFFGLMIFIIPQIGKIVKNLAGPNAHLPGLTLTMLAISHVLTSYWYIIIPVVAGLIFGILRYIKTPIGKSHFHHLILKIPGLKTIVIKVAISRFARTFSALMGAGVAVLESIQVTSNALGNVAYQDALTKAGDAVKNGAQLSKVLEDNPLFPAIVSQMLAVGEETGQTETVLVKVADFYDEEVDVAIDGISSIIEPVMIVIMGAMVGLIAASVMLPIVGLAQQIQS